MDLVYSVALVVMAVILFVGFLPGNRMAGGRGLASEGMTADLLCVAIASLFAFGIAFGGRFILTMHEQAVGLKELVLVAVTLAACYLIVRRLAPRRRLSGSAEEPTRWGGTSESSPANVAALVSPEHKSGPPSEPPLTKAA